MLSSIEISISALALFTVCLPVKLKIMCEIFLFLIVASSVASSSFIDPILSRRVANLDVLILNVYVSFSFLEESNNSHN